MKTRLLGTICFSVFVLIASMSHASVVYRYQGENYDIAHGAYDTTMSITGTVEFATPLPPNLFEEVFPISFRFDNDVDAITNENATSSRFGFATDNLGDIIGWQISVHDENVGGTDSIYSEKVMLYSQDHSVGNIGLAANSDNPGSWNVVPIPAAVWLFGSGLLGLVGIARCKKAA